MHLCFPYSKDYISYYIYYLVIKKKTWFGDDGLLPACKVDVGIKCTWVSVSKFKRWVLLNFEAVACISIQHIMPKIP